MPWSSETVGVHPRLRAREVSTTTAGISPAFGATCSTGIEAPEASRAACDDLENLVGAAAADDDRSGGPVPDREHGGASDLLDGDEVAALVTVAVDLDAAATRAARNRRGTRESLASMPGP